MKRTHLIFVGGFLGAGKTTLLKRAAYHLARKGKSAGLITNDQAEGLVDTYFLSGCGVPAEEVAGSCFCCNFPGLVEAIKHSVETVAPDVILAEPVGSCTDIVATVLRPMRTLMGDAVDVKAYSVLVEPDPMPTTQESRWETDTVATVIHEDPKAQQKADIGLDITAKAVSIGPNQTHTQTFQVFAGPKTADVLTPYGAEGLASYRKVGWFRIPLAWEVASVISPLLD